MKLQLNKTYVTNAGEIVTLSEYNQEGNYHCFIGSNGFYYGIDGFIFEGEPGNPEDISHELRIDLPEDEPQEPFLIDVLKFKQKSNGVKRKLILKDYSDETLEIIFKTKFSKEQPEVTNGLRLSYEGVYMLYLALEHLLDEHQGTVH